MADAQGIAATIALPFAPILQTIADVVHVRIIALHSVLNHAGRDVPHNAPNHAAWVALAIAQSHVESVVPPNVPNLVDQDVFRPVLLDVQTIVLVSVIVLAMVCAKDIAAYPAEGHAMNTALAVHIVANTLTTEHVDLALPTA